jgi:hypothetical protein
LDAQERLNRSEGSYAAALVAYNVALVQLKRATGVLLECQPIEAAAHLPQRNRTVPIDAPAHSGTAGLRENQPAEVEAGNQPVSEGRAPIPTGPMLPPTPYAAGESTPTAPLAEVPTMILPAIDKAANPVPRSSGP